MSRFDSEYRELPQLTKRPYQMASGGYSSSLALPFEPREQQAFQTNLRPIFAKVTVPVTV